MKYKIGQVVYILRNGLYDIIECEIDRAEVTKEGVSYIFKGYHNSNYYENELFGTKQEAIKSVVQKIDLAINDLESEKQKLLEASDE